MNSRLLIRPKADSDLETHALYLSTEGGLGLGYKFLVEARKTFDLLVSQPNIGWRPSVTSLQLKTLRIFRISRFEKFLIFYQVIPNGVEILRVVHGSQDILALLRYELDL